MPEPDWTSQLETAYVGPRNSVEETLAQIWQQVLGLEKIGVQDNLFDLGGDSIRSIQIVGKARLATLDITVQQLFSHPTIEQVAALTKTPDGQVHLRKKICPFELINQKDRDILPKYIEGRLSADQSSIGNAVS